MYLKEISPLAQAIILTTIKLGKTNSCAGSSGLRPGIPGKISCLTGTFWASLQEPATWQEFLNQAPSSPMEGFVGGKHFQALRPQTLGTKSRTKGQDLKGFQPAGSKLWCTNLWSHWFFTLTFCCSGSEKCKAFGVQWTSFLQLVVCDRSFHQTIAEIN